MGAPARLCWAAALSLSAAALAPLPSHAQGKPASGKAAVCLIEPDSVAEVGTQVVGVVERLLVQRGDTVRAGQPLVGLRADVERANAGVAEARAGVDAEVRAASLALELAEQKLKRAQSLVAQSFLSEQALEQARGERDLARQKLAQARGQHHIYRQEQRVADAQLGLRQVKSPLSGVVVERYVNVGERVEDRPLLRVAVIDPLRVELMVPTAQYGSIAVGGQLTLRPELPGAAPVQATVRQVDKVMDAASNTFRVRLSLPNPGHVLPAGLRCKADLPGAAAAGAKPAPAPVAAPASTTDAAAGRVRVGQAQAAPVRSSPLRLALALD